MTEVGYTYGYHRRTNPLFMRLALLRAGLQPPRLETACELGFGQGVSLALHAATGPTRWYGTDINPEHVTHARRLVEAAGVVAELSADSFAAYAGRDDLPTFDYIVLHGVWSWVSDANRARLAAFAGRHLRPGGVLYISYNALPGQAMIEPVRNLVVQHAERAAGGTITERIDGALAFAERLLGTAPFYLQDHPRLEKAFAALKHADRPYLAHEYFNRDWQPMYFSEVASRLAAEGLVFAAPAGYGSAVDALLIEPAQQALLDGIDDPVLRETVRDFVLNRTFRSDYWVKPPVAAATAAAIAAERFVRASAKTGLPFELRAPLKLRGLGPPDATVGAVLDLLADRQPRSLDDLARQLGGGRTVPDMVEAIDLLLGAELVAAVRPADEAAAAQPAADRLNAHLLATLDAGSEIADLASPLLGGGFPVSGPEQGLLRAWRQGTPLDGTGPGAAAFAAETLPLLRSLMIA